MKVTSVKEDTTIPIPGRCGDYLLWIRGGDPLNPKSDPQIVDVWELGRGDSVMITNRYDDLPEWFELTPREARGHAAYALLPKVKAGQTPEAPVVAPNIWRVLAGDCIAWIGDSRSGKRAEHGILMIYVCTAYCLVAGEPGDGSLDGWQAFGALSSPEPDPNVLDATRRALDHVQAMGPGVIRVDGWAIG